MYRNVISRARCTTGTRRRSIFISVGSISFLFSSFAAHRYGSFSSLPKLAPDRLWHPLCSVPLHGFCVSLAFLVIFLVCSSRVRLPYSLSYLVARFDRSLPSVPLSFVRCSNARTTQRTRYYITGGTNISREKYHTSSRISFYVWFRNHRKDRPSFVRAVFRIYLLETFI